jgi:2,3,4,5-tetrahydropyridine-2-carboxylate N-succinyltransferase
MTSSNSALESTINQAWEDRAQLSPTTASKEVLQAVEHVINELNTGRLRGLNRTSRGSMGDASMDQKSGTFKFQIA